MRFESYLREQASRHPFLLPEDVVKLCYQASFGAEHLLEDTEGAERFFMEEYLSVPKADISLYEQISTDVCRINLSAWKKESLPPKWLFHMFVSTASVRKPKESTDDFLKNLKTVKILVEQGLFSFSAEIWSNFISSYINKGIRPIHHSELYRENEHPAYRIISSRFLRVLPLLKALAPLPDTSSSRIISIDGRAASGKTTIASQLEDIIDAGVIHMDDFFLPRHLRTKSRLNQIGGNVHYERFLKEVLPFISSEKEFAYRRFDCRKMDYGELRQIKKSKWRIVEGAYSCHPQFGDYMKLRVFSDIKTEEQLQRLLLRNGKESAEIFKFQWIPMEESYLKSFQIKERSGIIL